MARGVAAALRQHLADDGWVGTDDGGNAYQVRRDEVTMHVVTVEQARTARGRSRSIDRAVRTLLSGMRDPEELHALALPARDLPTVLTVPGRVWMMLGVRVYAIEPDGSVHQQVIA
ncbi:hypothetical protein [Nocardioides sp. REDSEA-S30_B4]|jgi:hypothetical protein|uniref:hypothetical protein n=1 Tax=Nocardioides sp. REDSEA-S30_B4 TaxID=1811552 RepID=UPI000B2DA18D|nr:hypothetical protein [Nocardioides sp. REDSEA-S30_B4]